MANITDLNGNKIEISNSTSASQLEKCFFCGKEAEPYQIKFLPEQNGRVCEALTHYGEHLCEQCQWQQLYLLLEKKANA